MADFLDEKRREMQERLKELRPLVDEFHRLEAAIAALQGVNTPSSPAPARRRSSGSSSGGSSAGGNGRRGRPRGSGTRGKQALDAVRAKPGITIPEIAEKMGIKQNYLYRVLPALAADGLVVKDGRGWRPKDVA